MMQFCLTSRETARGYNTVLNIEDALTEDEIQSRVTAKVDSEVAKHRLKIVELLPGETDWSSLVLDAAARNPPFSKGPDEKGFRDRIIGETSLQAMGQTQVPDRKVVLIVGDTELAEWLRTRIVGRDDVHVFSSFEEHLSLLQALSKKEDEARILKLQNIAWMLFYQPEDKSSLLLRWNIADELRSRCPPEVLNMPSNVFKRTDSLTFGAPEYLKHEGNRFYWQNRLRFDIAHWDLTLVPSGEPGLLSSFGGAGSTANPQASTGSFPTSSSESTGRVVKANLGMGPQQYQERLVRKASCDFIVRWSALDRDGQLVDSKLDLIEVGPVTWDPGPPGT